MSASSPTPSEARPRVGVSACLIGQPVRYDGRSKRSDWVVDSLARQVELVPICPEVELGLGVPRPAIQLRRIADDIRLTRCDDPRLDLPLDLTSAMRALARRRSEELGGAGEAAGLSGYVFKSRSPSCGPSRVPVNERRQRNSHDTGDMGDISDNGVGLFAAEFRSLLPLLPVLEDDLFTPIACDRFLRQVRLLYRWQRLDHDDAGAVLGFHQWAATEWPQLAGLNGTQSSPQQTIARLIQLFR